MQQKIALRKKGNDPAIIFQSEDKIYKKISWSKLRKQVATVANYFIQKGVRKGDRVAAYLPNIPETIIVMLASALLEQYSPASPDFGVEGVVDRFGQIRPKVFITTDGYNFNGSEINITEKNKKNCQTNFVYRKYCINSINKFENFYHEKCN